MKIQLNKKNVESTRRRKMPPFRDSKKIEKKGVVFNG